MAICTALALGSAGCQPTPEQGVIQYRQEAQYTQSAEETANATVLADAPARWEASWEKYGGKVSIKVDADVDIPEKEQWPVYTTQLVNFSQDRTDELVKGIFQDRELEESYKTPDKEFYRQQIIEARATIQDMKENPEQYDNTVEDVEESIQEYERLLQEAPEQSFYEKGTSKLKNANGNTGLNICADMGRKARAWLWIVNDDANNQGAALFYRNTDLVQDDPRLCDNYVEIFEDEEAVKQVSKSQTNAVAEAQAFIEQLGLSGELGQDGRILRFGTGFAEPFEQMAYGVVFTRLYNGLPRISRQSDDLLVEKTEEYTVNTRNERCIVVVDDMGVAGVEWYSPVEITQMETENVALLDFSEIQRVFENMISVGNAFGDYAERDTMEISAVRLRYAQINIPNDMEHFRAVPAWYFMGKDGEVYMALNATDGSMIEGS